MKFNSTRNKVNGLWEIDQTNTENIDKIHRINTDYSAFNYKKKPGIITLVENQQSISGDEITITKRLEKFPERALSSINVILKTVFDGDYERVSIESQYATHNISLDNVWLKYKFQKIDDEVYDLIITYKALAQLFNEVPLGYFYSNIPLFITIKIYFLNENSYFTTQSEGK